MERRGIAIRYGFVVLAVAVAFALRLALGPLVGESSYLLFFSAIAASAWFGGLGPGLLATGLAALLSIVVLDPRFATSIGDPEEALRLLIFLADGLIVTGLSGSLRGSGEAAQEARARAEAHVAELERTQSELQQSRDQLAAILTGVTDGITVQEKSGELMYANDAAARILGYESADQLVATPVRDIMRDFELLAEDGKPFPPERLPGRLALQGIQGPEVLFHFRQRATGAERWSLAAATPILDDRGQVRFAVNIFRDITADKQRQAARDAFLGILSHELRTPVTTIYAGAELLARRERLGEEQTRELSDDIRAEADRLHRLVEDLLVLSRDERDALDVAQEPVLVQHIAEAVVQDEQARWPDRRFKLQPAGDLPVAVGEPLYVEQILRNLVANGAKYSPPGGLVEVRPELLPHGVGVRVLDEGPGFPESEANRLFDLFYRSPATATVAPGAGIGLFVCRRLVRAMGGRIWATVRPEGGAEFGFSLPLLIEDEGD